MTIRANRKAHKQQLFSIREAAAILGMDKRTILTQGVLNFEKRGNRLYTTRRDLVNVIGYDSEDF